MNVIKLESDKFDEIKLLFKDIFMNEPWNDDWSNDKERNVPAYEFYKKNGFSELEGHISLVKMFD